jgi:hypothetical protein
MTPQEIFDTVAVHLMTQGQRSEDEAYEECLYRGPDGLKCAAGVLIPDDDYSWGMEGLPVLSHPYFKKRFDAYCVGLIESLQRCHDDIEPVDWLKRLEEIAAERGLSPAALDKWRAAS